jgi:glutathione synthase/RimK-type ligase-like ATP-grasp enzyme
MAIKLAGIKRKEIYSPNHVTNDLAIILKTSEELTKLGYEVALYDEEFIEKNNLEEKYVFSMAQGVSGIMHLQEIGKSGKKIINSPESALNCHRISMINLIVKAGVPFPKSLIINTNTNFFESFITFQPPKVWLKRGDVHAEHSEDVLLVYSTDELKTTLKEFNKRGIKEAVIQEHLQGDVIKFYAVNNPEYFYWFYLNGTNHTKFDLEELKHFAFRSAVALGLDIFGGDAIVSPEGKISIIDINDWPSFAPVRDEAANQIAQCIHKKVQNYV